MWAGRDGGFAAGRLRLTTGLALGAGALVVLAALTGFGVFAVRDGARRAAARFAGAGRFGAFFGAFARFAAARAGFAAPRPFRPVLPAFLEAAAATRREEDELRFGRLARPPVGRFLAMSV